MRLCVLRCCGYLFRRIWCMERGDVIRGDLNADFLVGMECHRGQRQRPEREIRARKTTVHFQRDFYRSRGGHYHIPQTKRGWWWRRRGECRIRMSRRRRRMSHDDVAIHRSSQYLLRRYDWRGRQRRRTRRFMMKWREHFFLSPSYDLRRRRRSRDECCKRRRMKCRWSRWRPRSGKL